MSEYPGEPIQSAGGNFAELIEGLQEAYAEFKDSLRAAQDDANQDSLKNSLPDDDVTALGISIKTKKLERRSEMKERAQRVEESVLVRKEAADDLADQFSKRDDNREYHLPVEQFSRLAQELGVGLNENLSAEQMIAFLRTQMKAAATQADPAFVDKAFQFLIEVARQQAQQASGIVRERFLKIEQKLMEAQEKHFSAYRVEIQVTKKIIGAVDAVVNATGQAIQATLEHYRDIVHNPPDTVALYRHYQPQGYRAMVKEFQGLSRYLGENLKRVLENPELGRLNTAAKKMQAILGVFKDAKVRSRVVYAYLKSQGLQEGI